jgi:uncharacterized protein
MQSNGVLLSKEAISLFAAYDARVGISIDGFKEANAHRALRHGGSSFEKVKGAIDLLNANETGKRVLSGFLAVIDVQTDPLAVYKYLASHDPKSLDFLLPHATHDSYPNGKHSFTESPYADWLIVIFDYWFNLPENRTRIKYFNNIIALLIGGQSEVESLGHPAVNIVTIETNGDIEGIDTLKVAFDGAPALQKSVFTSTFDEVLLHPAILSRMQGLATLAPECRKCALVDICGGGYLPHRFSTDDGFSNPSVYCHDIAKLILHIRNVLLGTLTTKASAPKRVSP